MSPRLPTRRADWRLLGRTLRLVLSIPTYAALAVLAAVLALSVFVFSQNVPLVSFALTGSLPLDGRLTILLERYPFVGTDFGPVTGLMLVAISGLTGADIAMVVYHVREHGLSVESGGGSAVGVVLGVLGAGCAACGSAILVGVLSLVGATGLLTALPLEGLEFTLLAAVVLVLSLYWLADGMRGGEIRGCPVDLPQSRPRN
ncbi:MULTISPECIES: hypothetical protein [Salinibaculum]|uniref:hypothetical protein n=1 Tax=Salinibaculum TaxID=2732368 RepID=UPI0030D225BE